MIPPTPHAGTASEGEIEVFRRLQDDPGTQDWVVLHSLDVTHHTKQLSGEIDFVVIVPAKGVLCVEVKGCHSLRRAGGLWYYGTATQPDSRGPFKQVSATMHSLRKELAARHPSLSGVLFWSVVIFPYIPFLLRSEEWYPWQVIDSGLFTTRPIGVLLERVLDDARASVLSRSNTPWLHPRRAEPTPSQCLTIAGVFRPSFEFFESPQSRAHRQEEELKHYTTEQFVALDAMEANPRVMFYGPAGTGKTMLAIETARRSCERGRNVLFLCYNRLLGKWLEGQVTSLRPNVVCKTLHSYMLTLSGLPGVGQEQHFWHHTLPLAATDMLLGATGEGHLFDELVVDEAQDVLRDVYLDVLDLSLRGGLPSGRWRLFGDFEKQAIYHTANLSLERFLQARGGQAPVYALRTNCRNTPRIAELVHLLGGLQPRYTKILRPDNRIEPELIYYTSPEHQQQLLLTKLHRLYAEGFTGHDIVVLSPKVGMACAAGSINIHPWKNRLRPIETAGHGHTGYSSIPAFKGMEAPVVLVTDIDHISSSDSAALFYIAITRALQRLVIFMHEHVKKDIATLLHLPSS
jgi:hypothetical protein